MRFYPLPTDHEDIDLVKQICRLVSVGAGDYPLAFLYQSRFKDVNSGVVENEGEKLLALRTKFAIPAVQGRICSTPCITV